MTAPALEERTLRQRCKELEEALHAAELRFALAQEAGGIGVWDWDLRSGAIAWSPQQYRVLGLDPERDAADPYGAWLRVLHPDDRAAADASAKGHRSKPGPFSSEFRVIAPDGQARWILSKGLVSFDRAGRPRRMVGVNMDITDRKRAEEHLADSLARLRLASEVAGFGIFEFDFTRPGFRVDARASAITGGALPPERWLALDGPEHAAYAARIHPEDSGLRAAMGDALRHGLHAIAGFECRYRRTDGSWGWISQRCTVVERDPATGETRRAVGILADVTEHAEAEAALRRTADDLEREVAARTAELAASEARFRAYFEHAEDCLTDFEATADGRFLLRACNPATERLHGIRSRDAEGRRAEDLFHPDVVGPLRAALLACRDTGFVRYEPVVPTAQATRHFDTIFYAVPGVVGPEGGVRILGSARDVTERRDLERRMAQVEKLSALGQLAGGIAHDLNNVLQGVAGAAALIEKKPGEPEAVRRLARLLGEAAQRGSTTTRRLLAFARQDELRAEPIAPGPLLEGMREILAPALGVSIAVQVDIEPELPPLLADKGQLETALVNLATNARDAMPEGGRLLLAARRLEVVAPAPHPAGLPPGCYVVLEIHDSGCGMDFATLRRASEPFFTTKPPGRGTGLGLAMVRGFAEQSGGALAIDSAPQRGTRVSLYLPQSILPATLPPVQAPALPAGAAPPMVLVVDDDSLVRSTLAAGLASEGFRVAQADSGEAALALLDGTGAPDALVTDLSMPGMDGLALIRAVQAKRRGMPAVLLTGYAGDSAALAVGGITGGPIAVLRKPIGRQQLTDRLASLLAAGGPAELSGTNKPAGP